MKPNSLIKHDDLYWSDEEQRHVALSHEETEAIILAAVVDDNGKQKDDISIEDITNVVSWASHIRVGQHLLKGVLSGRIKINIDEEKEPKFYEVENDIT